MKFEHDIFISYAHIDNRPVGQEKWIETFHERLAVLLSQQLGDDPEIWRDLKLQGNDYFDETIVDQLPGTALLVSVLSPRYVGSEWCIKEVRRFLEAANQTGGVSVESKSRIFKVVKTLVPLEEQPSELQGMLGYQFFKIDPQSGRPREFSQRFGPDAEQLYWAKLDDLAYDISDLLKIVNPRSRGNGESASAVPPTGITVYLATTASDLNEEHDQIRRELLRRGHTVLPNKTLPLNGPELERLVRENLADCTLSIHLVGEKYGLVPEDAERSMVELQYEVAAGSEKADLACLIWLPTDLAVSNERQQTFVEKLKSDPGEADLLQTSLEEFKTYIQDKLTPLELPPALDTLSDDRPPYLYLIFHPLDQDAIVPLDDYFYDAGFEVKTAFFDNKGDLIPNYHQKMMDLCDTILLYYDQAPPAWVELTLSDLSDAPDMGRKATAVYVAGQEDSQKARFRTRAVDEVIKNFGEFSADSLAPFLSKTKMPSGGTG